MNPKDSDIKHIAIDWDGTMVQSIWPERGIGDWVPGALIKLEEVIDAGWYPIIHTARAWYDYEPIKAKLEGYGLIVGQDIGIVCGKLLAVAYVDDRALVASDASWVPGSRWRQVSEYPDSNLVAQNKVLRSMLVAAGVRPELIP